MFWMWVMALLGMMTSYAENVLGICYRRRDAAGRWCGGPMSVSYPHLARCRVK